LGVPESPEALGLRYSEWRDNQKELIEQILSSKRRTQLVEAPTGFGKSAVAAALSLLGRGRILILTKTIQLQEQYLRDFPHMRSIKGKGDFNCILPSKENTPVQDAPCSYGWSCPQRSECPYYVQSRQGQSARVLVSNYSKAFSTYLGKFEWIVCDEGHLLEKQILAANTIRLPYKSCKDAGFRVPAFGSIHEAATWAESRFVSVENEMNSLRQVLAQSANAPDNQRQRYRILRSISFPLKQLAQADTSALWSMEPYKKVFYFRPIWANDSAHQLFNYAERVVVQSATILDGDRLANLLGLKDFDYISLPSTFPSSRRPIYYAPITKMGMNAEAGALDLMIDAVDTVIDKYPRRRGIIHSVNMTLTEAIGARSKYASRLVVQSKGVKRAEAIDTFLRTPYAILVSPSVMTGLDGRFETARFQIMPKVPFEDQGDKSVAERLEQDPEWYSYQTAFNIQQAVGRVMRDRMDYGETWILDEHFGWFSKQYWHLFSEWFKEALKKRKL